LVAQWEKMCLEWEEEDLLKTKKNPYETDGVSKCRFSFDATRNTDIFS